MDLARKQQRLRGLRLPEPDNRAPSARPQGSTGLSGVDRPARWCVDESRISSSPHIDQGVDTQAATLRATRRTRPGTTSPSSSTVATANRWHEHPDIVGEASTSLHVVSRTTPVWRNLEHNETSVTEPAETTNGCQIRRSPQSLCTTRPLTLADARSPKRAPSPPGPPPRRRSPVAKGRPSWSALPPKGPATSELCCFCFQVLLAHLQSQPPPSFPMLADPLFKAPLFVTWMKRRKTKHGSTDLELRGCIGCLEPVVFSPGLSDYALRSSLQDKRFPPIQLEELPLLTCKLSILYQFEPCLNIYDWQVGLHGVLINFLDAHGRRYSATYLPEVAREHSMTRDVAIRELVVKSGYAGPCGEDLLSRMQVTRYQTLVEGIAYWDYLCLSGSEAPPGLAVHN